MVEVQTNLVHSAAMRRAVSLSYDDISDDPESAPSLLLVALVHSGASHQYERLQHLRDIFFGALALRGARDEQSFKKKLEQTGAWLTAVAGLEFAGKLFGAERCRELANELRPVRHSDLAWHLLGRSLATSTRSDRSMLHSWRRQLFRELIKLRRPGFGRIFE
jgi:hypothetical protein